MPTPTLSRSLCTALVLGAAVLLVNCAPVPADSAPPSPPDSAAAATFAGFVDAYLLSFAERHPSIAAGNGIHDFDGRLEDFSAAAIEREIAELKAQQRTLRSFKPVELTPDEQIDLRILDGVIDGWLLELETLQNWRRNPMLYAAALSDGMRNLITQETAPAPVRMRQVIRKLEQVPQLLSAAHSNLVNPPLLFAQRGAVMMRGVSAMLTDDVASAFKGEKGTPLMDSLQRAIATARPEIDTFVLWLEQEVIPSASGNYAIGADAVARRYRSEELIDVSLDTLLRIGERELAIVQADFRAVAQELAPGVDALTTWQSVRAETPRGNEVIAGAQRIVDSLTARELRAGYMRETPGKVRRMLNGMNPFPQPSSGKDGWEHYVEKLVVDEGYADGEPRYRLAQVSNALVGICRLLSGIRVHRGEWTLAQAQACFEHQAYMAAPAAQLEAERATYDPTYGGYFLGKRGLLALRRDVQRATGDSFNLRAFHERILRNGLAPVWAHRQLLLPGNTSPVIQ